MPKFTKRWCKTCQDWRIHRDYKCANCEFKKTLAKIKEDIERNKK